MWFTTWHTSTIVSLISCFTASSPINKQGPFKFMSVKGTGHPKWREVREGKKSRIWQWWEALSAAPFAYSVEMSAVQTRPTQGSWLHCFSSQVRSHLVNSFFSNIAGETHKARPDASASKQQDTRPGRCLVKFLGASVHLGDLTRIHWEGNCIYWCQGRLGLILSNQWATCLQPRHRTGRTWTQKLCKHLVFQCVADFAHVIYLQTHTYIYIIIPSALCISALRQSVHFFPSPHLAFPGAPWELLGFALSTCAAQSHVITSRKLNNTHHT